MYNCFVSALEDSVSFLDIELSCILGGDQYWVELGLRIIWLRGALCNMAEARYFSDAVLLIEGFEKYDLKYDWKIAEVKLIPSR